MVGSRHADRQVGGVWRAVTTLAALAAVAGVGQSGPEFNVRATAAPVEQAAPEDLPEILPELEIATTTTQPEREVQPGEVIATMRIPRLCDLEITTIALGDDELDRVGWGPDYENGGSRIDVITPDDDPPTPCPEAEERTEFMRTRPGEQQNSRYATRAERTNRDYPAYLDRNQNGRQDSGETAPTAEDYEPLAGHWPGTALPGEPGNAVIFGHRTTRSAPFASQDMLQPGDQIIMTTDGAEYTYKVVEEEVVHYTEVDRVLSPEGFEEGAALLTLFACTPQGSAEYRIVTRAILTPS